MTRYTAITFAPVQGFIEKSRKLRDLYGSSFILSFLAKTICNYATQQGAEVILPALIDVTRGVPNNIYLTGSIDEKSLKDTFDRAWKALVNTCRQYIEQEYQGYLQNSHYRALPWKREWDLWEKHTWELFIVCGEEGETLDDVRGKIADRKQARDWIGINWRGESSTLSGADAIAYPNMTEYNPKTSPNADAEIKEFYEFLSQNLPDSSVEPRERLSIPELVKRLITYVPVRQQFYDNFSGLENHEHLAQIEYLRTFTEIDRWEGSRWTGWFQGDGDRLGKYISSLVSGEQEATARDTRLQKFSRDMLQWGEALQSRTNRILGDRLNGRIVYAGGDDFFGVLYRNSEDGSALTPRECIEGFWYQFNALWNQCNRPISVSTGFVWAAPNVPQRDLLQHLRTTEKLAKTEGRDRLAIRILFNSGNYLDWSCPWRFLEPLFTSYHDRDGNNKNWTHLYTDIATLESRHAFSNDDSSIAQGIFDIYFPHFERNDAEDWWNQTLSDDTYQRLEGGLLGNKPNREREQHQRRDRWIINLAKVGFHLFS
ncbi:Cas10/Cmr2 second palm domain-containing protein [Chamaesiphon polymorphus]|uniref:CRISPR-associated protein n=1 Tax=Chamaesiphon polymorphus CCALA 037 TaxID=2107692 RepID=A0A2T1GLL7_9CYAN|nr:type III-B CRISPR-associated protein Cas10/Cmr2 [Chamaesiphon polymorphus]PSB58772.1 CRISPR-associated protein [Chamaesiphon polymorphus CCALA 037]